MAIAVPLFVGALNNAEETVKDANIRSVRSTAAAAILLNDPSAGTTTKDVTKWKATALVTKSGDVHDLVIVDASSDSTGTDDCVKAVSGTSVSGSTKATDKDKYLVTVYLTVQDVKASITGKTAG